ncbi:alpha/beta hydrolase [Candidatus Pacearchaeota archaeon]|nr:alpha/beta hydrolase [Candidatus Pacearchaeota archaeon]
MEKAIFKNSQGLNLIGNFYPHERNKGIIFCHGFTGDRHEWGHFDIIAEKLSKHFNVLAFDFSGHGESDNDAISVEKEIDDLKSAIDFFRKKGIQKIGILGLSLGGLIALKNYSLVESLVLLAPVTHSVKDYEKKLISDNRIREEKGFFIKRRLENVKRKEIVIDPIIVSERASVNPKKLLSKINYPALVIHGTHDEVIPLDDSKMAVQYLPKGELEIIDGAGHIFNRYVDKVAEISLNWFKKYL